MHTRTNTAMARTRSTKASTKKEKKESSPEPVASHAKPLPASDANPRKLFVLPKDTSVSARIVTLNNPANGVPSRYFFCPQKGFYEFTRIGAPARDCRSWLIMTERGSNDEKDEKDTAEGYITKSASIFVATPIDALFFLLPALSPLSQKQKAHFLSLEDHLDALCASSPQWTPLLSQHASLKPLLERRIAAICDTVPAGDETMYRLSHAKLLSLLLAKATRMTAHGLPPSLEERYIKPALEVPIMSIRREETNTNPQSTCTADPSQPSATQETQASTPDAALPPPPLETPPSVPPLLRLRTALTYLTSTYLPPHLHAPLQTLLATPSPSHPFIPDFTPLTTHLSALSALRASAAALRSISDNITRKREYAEDEEALAEREEKRRKKEDEERKKKAESRGIKQLKKADTSGMKKLSSFFTKAPKKA